MADSNKQRALKTKYSLGDPTVDQCICGDYYFCERRIAANTFEIFNHCLGCRRDMPKLKRKFVDGDGNEICETQIQNLPVMPTIPRKRRSKAEMAAFREAEQLKKENAEKEKDTVKECLPIPSMPQEEKQAPCVPMNEIETQIINDVESGEKTIPSVQDEINVNGTQETKTLSVPKSLIDDGKEIQPLASSSLSEALGKEGSNSITQLNNMSEQLISYAKIVAKPITANDDENDIIRRPGLDQILAATEILDKARNVMKTKLDYLKLGKDLINGK